MTTHTTDATEQTIDDAYQALATARTALHESFMLARDARMAYEDAKGDILLRTDPKALGSNETIRAAALDGMLPLERAAVRQHEAQERAAQCAFELALIEVRRIETRIKWLELTQ